MVDLQTKKREQHFYCFSVSLLSKKAKILFLGLTEKTIDIIVLGKIRYFFILNKKNIGEF